MLDGLEMFNGLGALAGHEVLAGLNTHGGLTVPDGARLQICDQFYPNGLANSLGMELLEL